MFCDQGLRADGEISLVRAKLGTLVDERVWASPRSVDTSPVRREALLYRMEVKDLHLLAVVAVG
jgi:hypothetical protein